MSKSMLTFGTIYTLVALYFGLCCGCTQQPVQPAVEEVRVELSEPMVVPPGQEKALAFTIQPDGTMAVQETLLLTHDETITLSPQEKSELQRKLQNVDSEVSKALRQSALAEEQLRQTEEMRNKPADAQEAVLIARLEEIFELEIQISERSKILHEKMRALDQEAEKNKHAIPALLKKLKEAQDKYKSSPWEIGRGGSPMF
jgi:hypothetical protein